MKTVVLSLLFFTLGSFITNAQGVRFEGFEGDPNFVTLAAGGFEFVAAGGGASGNFINGNTAANDRPASVPYASSGSTAFRLTNNTYTLTSGTFSTAGLNFVALRFRLQAVSLNTTNGMELSDFVRVEISPDGGTTYFNTAEITGSVAQNAWWGYSATGTANATYDGNNVPTVYTPLGTGQIADGPSTVIVRGLPVGNLNVRIRITLENNNANERWVIDDVNMIATAGAPLPISFANVSAKEKEGNVLLSWSNLSESNVDYYAVERSADGKNFAVIANVQPKGNDANRHDYSFIDESVPSHTNYYRIKAVEFSNTAKLSVIIKVSAENVINTFAVYPNPVQNKIITLQAGSVNAGAYSVRLINANGQQVFAKIIALQQGAVSQSIELPTGIAPGIYLFKIEGAGTKSVTTLCVQ